MPISGSASFFKLKVTVQLESDVMKGVNTIYLILLGKV